MKPVHALFTFFVALVESACLVESEIFVGEFDGNSVSNLEEVQAVDALDELKNYGIDTITTCEDEDGYLAGMQYSIASNDL